jgi:hypothetical protein
VTPSPPESWTNSSTFSLYGRRSALPCAPAIVKRRGSAWGINRLVSTSIARGFASAMRKPIRWESSITLITSYGWKLGASSWFGPEDLIIKNWSRQRDYLYPARYDQEIIVQTEVVNANSRTIEFAYQIRSADPDRLLARGSTRHIWLNREWRPVRLPEQYREVLRIG